MSCCFIQALINKDIVSLNVVFYFDVKYWRIYSGSVFEWLSALTVIVIDMVLVQNLLTPFGCDFGKDTLLHFPLLGRYGKQF